MNVELSQEHRMIKKLVRSFVHDELTPLEPVVPAREAEGGPAVLTTDEWAAPPGDPVWMLLHGLCRPKGLGGRAGALSTTKPVP